MSLTKKLLAPCALLLVAITLLARTGTVTASVNYNNVISDGIFDNTSSMTAAQINSFLNGYSNSCLSPNNGYSFKEPTGYSSSTGFKYGSNVTAGVVIKDASTAYGINPRVILTTLEKEEGLVKGDGPYGCSALAFSASMGYLCTDSGSASHNYTGVQMYVKNGVAVNSVNGTCVPPNSSGQPVYVGFSAQVINASWSLSFSRHRSEGQNNWYAQYESGWDNSDDLQWCYRNYMANSNGRQEYQCPDDTSHPSDPYVAYSGKYSIDSTAVTIADGATAALYTYTPHLHGQSLFYDTWTNFQFGPILDSGFNWQEVSQASYTDQTETTSTNLGDVWPGQRYYLTVTAKNVGSQTWTPDIVHLGTANPIDGNSPFYDSTWLWSNRAASINPSPNTSVAPGATGTFSFWVTIPNKPGIQRLYMCPVADGYSWFNCPGLNWEFNIQQPTYTWQWQGQGAYTDQTMGTAVNLNNVTPGERYYLAVKLKNTGNEPWNPGTLNLATSSPGDRSSVFYDNTWLSKNRTATVPSVVQPGQTTTIGFWVRAPLKLNQGGTYREYFRPVAEGITWLNDQGLYWQFKVPDAQYSWQWEGQAAYTDQTKSTPANLNNATPGQRYYLTLTMKNTGNVVWYPGILNLGTSNPTDSDSPFHDSTWLSSNRAVTVPSAIQPGQTTTLGFWVTIPNSSGTHKLYFRPVADGVTWLNDVGLYWQVNVQ